MAINPELITTIRVDQLPDGTLNLTNKIPHTSGTVLEKASVQDLVDLVATAIGVSGGVGYIALSVTDGQQLPDVPELPSFFLCGAGTFLNINGYPNIICTENLNAIMSLTDHWELAVEIPINPLSGTVQSVTGSAVDNTDPLNPVINEIISGVQNIIAGTNITVDNTDPANPIVSATGGGGSQTLQEVTDEGNTISSEFSIITLGGAEESVNVTNVAVPAISSAVLSDGFYSYYPDKGSAYTSEKIIHSDLTTTKNLQINFPTSIVGTNKVQTFQDADGTIALLSDITTPTLQQVLDNNHDLVDNNNFQGTDAGYNNTGTDVNAFGFEASANNEGNNVNALGNSAANNNEGINVNVLGISAGSGNTGNAVNALGQETGFENIGNDVNALGFRAGVSNTFNNVNLFGEAAQADENGQTVLSKDGTIMARLSTTDLTATRKYNLPNASGTIALTTDIPTGGGGIPHATASGTDTYTATVTGVAAYTDADAYLIRFTNGNTTGATLNINSLGAKTLYRNNDGALIGGDIVDGGEMLCIYNTSLNGFQVIGTAPNSLFAYVTNDDSVTITKGMPVYAFSGTGDRMTVKRANNSADATSAQTVGLVLSTSIAAGQKGLIMMQGLLDGLSILPTSTFADGDAVYLGATDGSITNVKPYAPNHLVYLGVVTTASNGSAARMYVRIQNGYELSEIHDVDLISNAPTNNQVLTYESSTDLWKNKTIIQDSITDGVTTIAPSQNAVFDALALKQAALSYTPYKNVQTSQTSVTGTTAETVVFTATIPAGAFNSTDVIKVLFGANKSNSLLTYTLRLRVNTTNTISGSTIIGLYSGSATPQLNVIMRNFNLNGGNLYGFPFTTSGITDIAAVAASLASTTLNPSNQFFIFATVQLNSINDSIIGNMLSISN